LWPDRPVLAPELRLLGLPENHLAFPSGQIDSHQELEEKNNFLFYDQAILLFPSMLLSNRSGIT